MKVRKYFDPGLDGAGGEVNEVLDSPEQPAADQQTAESLNTEGQESKLPEHIPYERFKEVNEAKKALEERLSGLGDDFDPQLYKSYADFDKLLVEKPELYEKVRSVLEGSNQNEQGQVDPMQTLTKEIEGLKASQVQMLQKEMYQSYVNEYNKHESSLEGYSDKAKETISEMAGQLFLAKTGNNPYGANNSGLVGKAFDEAKQKFDAIRSDILGGYSQDKATNSPVIPKGAPVQEQKAEILGDKKGAYIAEALRKSRQS